MTNSKSYQKEYRLKNNAQLRIKEREYLKNLSPEMRKRLKDRRRKHDQNLYNKGKELVNKYKDVPCADCGHKYPPCVMDFDHIKDTKKFTIANKLRSVELLLQEIAKCEVVCANCHRIRTHITRTGHAHGKNIYFK